MAKQTQSRKRSPKLVSGAKFLTDVKLGRHVLLIAPPIYDFRLDWPHWQQPAGLLQLATWLLRQKVDVKLIDCLYINRGERLSRRRIDTLEIDGNRFHKWHFGLSLGALETRIISLLDAKWQPDAVLVTCGNSIWWEGARDTIRLLRKIVPKAKLILGGAYPTVDIDHASQFSGADVIVTGPVPEVRKLPTCVSLYEHVPYSSGIYFYGSPGTPVGPSNPAPRRPSAIVKEVKAKAEAGVREFVFFDSEISLQDREAFGTLLDQLAAASLKVHFVLPGNVSPNLITRALARKLRRARVTQIYLHCDLDLSLDAIKYTTELRDYEHCVAALLNEQVVKPRDGTLAAMLVVGFPYENLEAVSEQLIRLEHIVGSVMLVPFQYVPALHKGKLLEMALSQNGHFTPESFNSKLFPLARLSGKSIEAYMELMRLAALLNSKYRSKTFDFLGDSFAGKFFRQTLRTGAWNPFPDQSQNTAEGDPPQLRIMESHADDRAR